MSAFSVLSYNINFGAFAGWRPGAAPSQEAQRVLQAILEADADVVCLQETSEGWQEFLTAALEMRYPKQEWINPDMWLAAGSAMLCKASVDVDWLEPVRAEVEGSFFPQMAAGVRIAGQDQVCIGNVHLRPPLAMGQSGGILQHADAYFVTAGKVHEKELQAVIDECSKHVEFHSSPVIVVGDFNEGAWGRGVKSLASHGFTDAANNSTTWYWPVPLPFGYSAEISGKYDHVLFQRDRLRLLDCQVLHSYKDASDHLPVLAKFSVGGVVGGGSLPGLIPRSRQ